MWKQAITLALLAGLCVGNAQAQSGTYQGIRYSHLVTQQPTEPGLDWAVLVMQNNYANEGDKAAFYSQHNKYGRAPGWAGVFETRCVNRDGNCWGVEIDIGTNGGSHIEKNPPEYRIGLGIVQVNDTPNKTRSEIDYGIWVLPFYADYGKVSTRYGVRVDVPCTVACFSVPSGQNYEFSDDPLVGKLKFDPESGFTGFWKHDTFLIWGFNNTTGQVLTNWQKAN
jgi:hypothetical protein